MSDAESSEPTNPDPETTGFRYFHRYRDAESDLTLKFPVGWLEDHGLTYDDGEVRRDGVPLEPDEYPSLESHFPSPTTQSTLDQLLEQRHRRSPDNTEHDQRTPSDGRIWPESPEG